MSWPPREADTPAHGELSVHPAWRAGSTASPTRSPGPAGRTLAEGSRIDGAGGSTSWPTASAWSGWNVCRAALPDHTVRPGRPRGHGAGRRGADADTGVARGHRRIRSAAHVRHHPGRQPGAARGGDVRARPAGSLQPARPRHARRRGRGGARPCRWRHGPRRRRSAAPAGWTEAASATSSAPFLQGVLNYADQRLDANLDLWRTGENILRSRRTCRWTSPSRGVEKRAGSRGRSRSRAHTDSVDLGLLEALTPAVDRVEGTLGGDVQVEGTWKRAAARGRRSTCSNGSMNVPGLGVRFGSVDGSALLQGDSVRAARCAGSPAAAVRSRCGAGCGSRTSPARSWRSTLRADQFRALDVRNFLDPGGDRRPPAPRPGVRRDPDRQPDGQQRRALLRRPGQQADHRPGGSGVSPTWWTRRSSGARTWAPSSRTGSWTRSGSRTCGWRSGSRRLAPVAPRPTSSSTAACG